MDREFREDRFDDLDQEHQQLARDPFCGDKIAAFYKRHNLKRANCHICLDLRPDLLELREKCVGYGDRYIHFADLENLKKSMEKKCNICAVLHAAIETFQPRTQIGAIRIMVEQEKGSGPFRPLEIEIYPQSLDSLSSDSRWFESQEREHLQVYTEQDAQIELPIGRAGTVSLDQSSEACFDLLQTWFSECCSTHEFCYSPNETKFPTRVISIATQKLHVYESKGGAGGYATLSHCWGGVIPLTTTKSNISKLRDEIRETDLPKTFRDAVTIARKLQIPYLWIDSLCIIQDDEDDWARESERMGSYYEDAILMIAADGAANSTEGCFRKRPKNHWDSTRIEGTAPCLPCDIFVRGAPRRYGQPTGHLGHSLKHPQSNGCRQGEPRTPESRLEKRAWAYQESILSRRTIHYSELELAWECHQNIRCECTDNKEWAKALLVQAGPTKSMDLEDPMGRWGTILHHYSTRSLTYPKDVLPAIAGIAQVLGKEIRSPYVCGIWKDYPQSLLWRPWFGASLHQHPLDSYAPSWSWASTIGPIYINGYSPSPQVEQRRCEILDIQWEPSQANASGPAKWRSELTVKGDFFTSEIAYITDEGHFSLKVPFAEMGHIVVPDIPEVSTVGERKSGKDATNLQVGDEIAVLVVQKRWIPRGEAVSFMSEGLALRRVKQDSSNYRRLGFYEYMAQYVGGFECGLGEEKTITVE